jgi:hypothetical protein
LLSGTVFSTFAALVPSGLMRKSVLVASNEEMDEKALCIVQVHGYFESIFNAQLSPPVGF